MDTETRILTISISSSMELELGIAKRVCYREDTQNEMFKDLIVRGLASLDTEKNSRKKYIKSL